MKLLGMSRGAILLTALFLLSSCGGDQARYDQAMEAFDRGEMEEAERRLTDLLVHSPDGPRAPDALLQRGILFSLYLDNPSEALADYRELTERFPRHPLAREGHRRMAELYDTHFDNPRKAVDEYQALLEVFPDSPGNHEARYRLGELFFRLLRFDEARAAFSTVAAGGKGAGEWAERAAFQVGVCYSTEGREPDAEAVWRDFLKKHPGGRLAGQAALNLASILERQGKAAEAITLLEEQSTLVEDAEPLLRRIERIQERAAQMGPGTRFRARPVSQTEAPPSEEERTTAQEAVPSPRTRTAPAVPPVEDEAPSPSPPVGEQTAPALTPDPPSSSVP